MYAKQRWYINKEMYKVKLYKNNNNMYKLIRLSAWHMRPYKPNDQIKDFHKLDQSEGQDKTRNT